MLPRTAAAIAIVAMLRGGDPLRAFGAARVELTTITILATFVGRPVAPLRALSLAIIVLLLIDPFLLHSLGFHLSCAASAGIAVLARPLAARLRGPQFVREPLAVSIAAQVGVTPVLLAAFGSVPVITPVANLLAYPAAEALGVFGLAASVAGGVVPPVGTVLAPITRSVARVGHRCRARHRRCRRRDRHPRRARHRRGRRAALGVRHMGRARRGDQCERDAVFMLAPFA